MATSGESVAALQNGVGHVPTPFHHAAGVVDPRLVEVGGGGYDGHSIQVRRQRVLAGQRVLRRAEVTLTGSGDATAGPGLASSPFHGVVAVEGLMEQRVVFAFGIEAATHVLAQHHVAVARKEPDGMVGVVQVAVFAIRPAIDQHRETTGERPDAPRRWPSGSRRAWGS